MGKKKIEIEYITHKQTRMVTFTKRRNGLFKKAEEFSKLSGSSIAILVFSETDKIYPSDTSPSFEATLDRFLSKTTAVVSNKDSCDFTFDGCRDLDKITSGSTSTSPGSSNTNAGSFNDSTEALLLDLELDDLPDFKLDLSDELDVYLKIFNSMPGTPNNSPGLSSTDAGSFPDSMKGLLDFNVDGCEDLEELLVFKSSLEALRERKNC